MNPYYDPEKFGLTIFGTADASRSYEFDLFVVWRNENGDFLWESGSGCSCPIPFDGTDLSNLPVGSAKDALNDLRVWVGNGYRGDRDDVSKELVSALETVG